MTPYILIYPIEIRESIKLFPAVLQRMHFVAEVDGDNVTILKNRYDSCKTIKTYELWDYLKKVADYTPSKEIL